MIVANHLLRFGTNAEKKYVSDFRDSYDVLMLNANIFAHCTNSISKFISSELCKKKFIIDPQTYAFQYYQGLLGTDGNLKKSIEKLVDFYGLRLKDIISCKKRSIDLGDFDSDDVFLKELCKNVIDFQRNTIKKESLEEKNEYKEYIEYVLEQDGSDLCIEPCSLIAPYFYLSDENFEQWLNINTKAIELSQNYSMSISAQLVINSSILLDTTKIDKLVNEYSKTNPCEVLLWIDNFDEKDVGDIWLRNYLYLLEKFKKVNIPVSQLYGSYFSLILINLGLLQACCHGMEYGESRNVFPVGGGVPISKFYLPIAHKRFHFRNIIQLLLNEGWLDNKNIYFEKVCDCPQCREIIKDDPESDIREFGIINTVTNIRKGKNGREYSVMMSYPTTEAKEICLRHYLYNKEREYIFIKEHNISEIIEQLKSAKDILEEKLGIEILYLSSWIRVLSSYLESSEL